MRTIEPFREEIKSIVSGVRKNFPFYNDLICKSGYDSKNDPLLLPFIDETVLADHYYSAEFPDLLVDQVYLTSGTSTGLRKKVLYSNEDHETYVEHRRRILNRLLTPDCKVACSDLGTGHAAASAKEVFCSLGLTYHHIDFQRPVGEHIELLNRYQPDVLFTMPMILDNILLAGGLDIRPKKILIVGDVASIAWKNHIVNRFGINRGDLTDLYGSIEVGSIAHECSRCNLYHFDDHILAEAVRPSHIYPDSSVDTKGDLVVLTSLARKLFPAIRYIPNDLVAGFRDYKCNGKYLFSFERLVGRIGAELKHGEKISMYDISSAVNEVLPGARFDVFKDSKRLLIRIVSPQYSESAADTIRGKIRGSNPDIDQMIRSGLVSDIEIEETLLGELSKASKLSFRQFV